MLPTLRKLNELLADEDLPVVSVVKPLTRENCETYGKQTFVYFSAFNMIQRRRIEDLLEAAGVKVNRLYCTLAGNCLSDSPKLEVRVSFLRARGWKE